MSLTIYEYPGFPNPARVRMAAAEKNLLEKIQFLTVDVPAGEHKKSEFLAKNPSGTVPVLELEDGTTISECTAITEYLDHFTGEPNLTGRTAKERALAHMMQRRAEAGLLDAIAAYFHHATPGLGPDIETFQCAEWGEHQRLQALTSMKYMDEVLSSQPYLAGETFTMADITAFAGLAFAGFVKIETPSQYQDLLAWQKRIASRPSVTG